MQPNNDKHRILVIKLSALGDFVQALGAMKAIREYHKNAHISLVTTKGLKNLAKQSNYFDDIIIDDRPKLFQILKILRLHNALNARTFDRVYDLQNNDRTGFYFKLFSPKPEWAGIAKGASHRNVSPDRTAGLAFEGHKQTLKLAGIENVNIDDLSWMKSDVGKFRLSDRFALIIPGSAPQHLQKRWGVEHYIGLCRQIVKTGIQPVLIGTHDEASVISAIASAVPESKNLTGCTDLFDLPELARNCVYAVGNDTGPMHFVGPTGAKTFVLFTPHSNPKRHRPLGQNVIIITYVDSKNHNEIWTTIQNNIH